MKTPTSLLLCPLPQKVHDPRPKQGQSHQFSTVLALIFLGLLAKLQLAFADFVKAIMQNQTLIAAVKKARIINESREWSVAQ